MKRFLTALAQTAILTAALAAPAAAGSITFNIEAQTANQANAIRTGLVIYQIAQDIETSGHISQNGLGNMAALAQGGAGNIGIIHQEGNGHDATLTQTGGGNSCGVFQFGENTSHHAHQTGGEACIVLQAGF